MSDLIQLLSCRSHLSLLSVDPPARRTNLSDLNCPLTQAWTILRPNERCSLLAEALSPDISST